MFDYWGWIGFSGWVCFSGEICFSGICFSTAIEGEIDTELLLIV